MSADLIPSQNRTEYWKFLVGIKNIDLMKKALDIKPLTEEIKEKFRERLMKLGDFSSL